MSTRPYLEPVEIFLMRATDGIRNGAAVSFEARTSCGELLGYYFTDMQARQLLMGLFERGLLHRKNGAGPQARNVLYSVSESGEACLGATSCMLRLLSDLSATASRSPKEQSTLGD